MPDGNVMLYDANADTFTVSRKDFTALSGAYAASSYNSYVVGNNLLNASLVPQATLETRIRRARGLRLRGPGRLPHHDVRAWPARASSSASIPRSQPEPASPPAWWKRRWIGTTIQPFIRSLAPLYDRSAVISLSVSGFTVLPWNYDAAVAPPKISSVVNAADGTLPVAPGGLISVYGQQMSPVNMATKEIPLPTALGESCLTVNGVAVPMLFVSPASRSTASCPSTWMAAPP